MGLRNLITRHTEDDLELLAVDGADPAVEDPANEDLAKLLNDLRVAHRNAGEPSFRNLAMLTNRQLSASTISRMFKATTPPKWKSLAVVLRALNVPKQDTARWHAQWAKAVNKIKPIVDPDHPPDLQTSAPAPATPCLQCGALVAEADIHTEWHRKLAHAEGLLGALAQNSKRTSQLSTAAGPLAATRHRQG
ncbi:hypothetical protein [Virgisporangium aurantiacum]|uniref:Uncharacterized protein n=1 Tax=Virgisporangium aurantiacum TaxID=175570 RepID=A0A8J3Z807_9ACTN|nr:hypothetical protein [Virgisporangium aurantiacum]GIJ58053.1 hypothetical protein Vau01_055690 [Virgisporangium aurantiacum]